MLVTVFYMKKCQHNDAATWLQQSTPSTWYRLWISGLLWRTSLGLSQKVITIFIKDKKGLLLGGIWFNVSLIGTKTMKSVVCKNNLPHTFRFIYDLFCFNTCGSQLKLKQILEIHLFSPNYLALQFKSLGAPYHLISSKTYLSLSK